MKQLFDLFRYAKPYRWQFFLAILFVVVETGFELFIPMVMADIIDVGLSTGDVGYIAEQGVVMAVMALISLVCGLLYARFAAIAANGFGGELRHAEFERIQQFSFLNIDHFETSSLITRMTNDVTVIQDAIATGLRPIVRGPAMLVLGLFFSFSINSELAMTFVVATPILGLILFFIVRKVAPMYKKLQEAIDDLNIIVEENLQAIRVVKAFVREDYEGMKFDTVNERQKDVAVNTFKYAVLNMPAFQFVMYGTIVMILFFGGNLIFAGKMQVGELTGFLSYVLQILNSMMMISNVFLMVTRSLASAYRIDEVFAEKLDLFDGTYAGEVKDGSIDFDHVSFKYAKSAKENVLSDVDMHIASGETIGVIGATGSAKSSLVQLIPRLYDATEGTVQVGGRNVKDYHLETLRDAVAIVLQKNVLFTGTVKENLLWGNEKATDAEIKEACHTAAVDEFIDTFPDGYDTYLDEGGVNVSGGQKQRLCIARALLKHPKIIIFDDSTSAVDTATEARIRDGLAKLENLTKIIIAQRITSIMHADRIYIIDDGKVVESGTHEELLAHSAIYQDLYESQMKGGEEDA